MDDILKTENGKNLFDKLKNKLLSQDIDPHTVKTKYILEKFLLFKRKKLLKPPYDDISFLLTLTLSEIENIIHQIALKEIKTQKSKDTTLVFENDKVLILIPNTYEAACKYGSNTKWCVSWKHTMSYYDALNNHEIKRISYFILPKNNDDKHIVYTDNQEIIQFTNKNDDYLTIKELNSVLIQYNIPTNIFKYKPRCMKPLNMGSPCFYCGSVKCIDF